MFSLISALTQYLQRTLLFSSLLYCIYSSACSAIRTRLVIKSELERTTGISAYVLKVRNIQYTPVTLETSRELI